MKSLSAIPLKRGLMNTHSEKNDNKKDNNKRTAKSIGAIPLAGIVVAGSISNRTIPH